VRILNRTPKGDVFNFAFFHFDGGIDAWGKEDWYQMNPNVVFKNIEAGCKVQYWHGMPEKN
jgi:hypothetical protein